MKARDWKLVRGVFISRAAYDAEIEMRLDITERAIAEMDARIRDLQLADATSRLGIGGAVNPPETQSFARRVTSPPIQNIPLPKKK